MKLYQGVKVFLIGIWLTYCSFNVHATSNKIDLIKAQFVTVSKKTNNHGKVQKLKVTQKKDMLSISGTVLLRSKHIRGHVDIALYSPENKLLKSFSTYAVIRRSSRGRGRIAERTAHFKVTFSMKPQEGSVVHVGFHKNKTVASDIFNCGDNISITD